MLSHSNAEHICGDIAAQGAVSCSQNPLIVDDSSSTGVVPPPHLGTPSAQRYLPGKLKTFRIDATYNAQGQSPIRLLGGICCLLSGRTNATVRTVFGQNEIELVTLTPTEYAQQKQHDGPSTERSHCLGGGTFERVWRCSGSEGLVMKCCLIRT